MAIKTEAQLRADRNNVITTRSQRLRTKALKLEAFLDQYDVLMQDIIDSISTIGSGAAGLTSILQVDPTTSGEDMIISSGDTIAFSNGGFTATLQEPTLAGNVVLTLPATTGTIALISDVEANNELSEILANGNTTGANDISIDSGQTIDFNVGSGGSLNSVSTASARTWDLPDKSGTIALISDVEASDTLSEILANGNTTGANDISIDTGQSIVFNNTGNTATINEPTLAGNIVLTLPDSTGTLALVSDLAITDDRIPRGDGTTIEDGTWINEGNHIYPVTTGSNIGQDANRIGTIYMSSTIDYDTGSALQIVQDSGNVIAEFLDGGNWSLKDFTGRGLLEATNTSEGQIGINTRGTFYATIGLTQTTRYTNDGYRLYNSAGVGVAYIGHIGAHGATARGFINLQDNAATDVNIDVGADSYVKTGFAFGFGTTSPGATLNVVGESGGSEAIAFLAQNSSAHVLISAREDTSQIGISIEANTTNQAGTVIGNRQAFNEVLRLYDSSSNPFAYFNNTHQVGIGADADGIGVDSLLTLDEDRSFSSVTGTGKSFHVVGSTLTNSDSIGGATVANEWATAFMQPTFDADAGSAGNEVTTTDAATVYIEGAPLAVTNKTIITNPLSLWVDAGTTRLDGTLDHNGTNVGFFGKAPAAQVADMVALTDNSGGTANNTIQALTNPTDSPLTADALRDNLVAVLIPELRNNFADLAAKINALRNFARAHGLMA